MRRLAFLCLLALLAVIGVACSVPGGEVTTATPDTVVGTLPTVPTVTVPAEYANGDAAAGKAVFTAKSCGACHTLAAAGATGTVGPNLDTSKPELGVIVDRVVNGKGAMPAFKAQLEPKQIADVSAYVAQAIAG